MALFSEVKVDTRSTDCDLGTNVAAAGSSPAHCGILPTEDNFVPGDAKIPAQSYFDLALTARVGDRYNFRLGANNILDKEPPIVGGEAANAPFGNGNTYPQVYDALGRFLFAGVSVDF